MKRGLMVCAALGAVIVALVLGACESKMAPLASERETSVNAMADANAAGGYGGGGAGAPGAYLGAHPLPATPLPAATRPNEEIWIVPTGDTPSATGAHSTAGGKIAGMPIPGSPVLAALRGDGRLALVPLQHTDVAATITGYIASVGVTQQFMNPYAEKIEAVYVLPLPENAGVNEFVMTIGERHIRGIIRERADAEKIYRLAKAQGYVASMMTQEGPNVFTQRVANIEPGKRIDVSVRYFHTLTYVDGWFEWDFPMVVGPRDGSARMPEVQYPQLAERSGRDISLKVTLDAGVAIEGLVSVNHKIVEPVARVADGSSRVVALDAMDSIPNKDFVLRYKVAGEKVKTGMFVQRNKEGTGGWFAAMVIPPDQKNMPGQTGKEVLSDVQADFAGMNAMDVYPRRIGELSVGKPVIICGRFTGAVADGVSISGRAGSEVVRYSVVPEGAMESAGIGTIWGRARLAELHEEAIREGRDIMEEVKGTALEYGIVSEYTSFVVVDATRTTDGGAGKAAAVPEGDAARRN